MSWCKDLRSPNMTLKIANFESDYEQNAVRKLQPNPKIQISIASHNIYVFFTLLGGERCPGSSLAAACRRQAKQEAPISSRSTDFRKTGKPELRMQDDRKACRRRRKPIAQDADRDTLGCDWDDEGNTARITIAKRWTSSIWRTCGDGSRKTWMQRPHSTGSFLDAKGGGSRATLLSDGCHKWRHQDVDNTKHNFR